MPQPSYNPWGTPIFPDNAAFGTGSPAEDAQRAPNMLDNLLSRIAGALGAGFIAPGQALNSPTPLTSEQMIAPAANMATMVTLGAGALPAGANELRAGVRPYNNVPNSLMGYRRNGPQKGFDEGNYPHTQDVTVTLPQTSYTPQETFVDQIKGMNPDHALERAWRNWPDALHIRAGK